MKNTKTPLSIALGTTLLSGLAATSVQAEPFTTNEVSPFAMTELTGGYMQVAEAETTTDADKTSTKKAEGSCGEGKCGGKMKKEEGDKTAEGKCGEGKCGEKMKKEGEEKAKEDTSGDKK